ESAQAAMSYVRSRAFNLGLAADFVQKIDLHVHFPGDHIPKDGPSAGITMATSIVSSLTRIPVRKDVAMTGEISLRGRVLPIGGLKEKTLAAHRAGIKTVIIPKENRKDLRDIPKPVRKAMNFVLVEHLDEVLKHALVLDDPDSFMELLTRPLLVPNIQYASKESQQEQPAPSSTGKAEGAAAPPVLPPPTNGGGGSQPSMQAGGDRDDAPEDDR
ncbi:MAG: S16 family serine protease, partial [Myxococcota bacterium]